MTKKIDEHKRRQCFEKIKNFFLKQHYGPMVYLDFKNVKTIKKEKDRFVQQRHKVSTKLLLMHSFSAIMNLSFRFIISLARITGYPIKRQDRNQAFLQNGEPTWNIMYVCSPEQLHISPNIMWNLPKLQYRLWNCGDFWRRTSKEDISSNFQYVRLICHIFARILLFNKIVRVVGLPVCHRTSYGNPKIRQLIKKTHYRFDLKDKEFSNFIFGGNLKRKGHVGT